MLTTFASFAIVAGLLVISPGPNGVLIAKTVPTSGRTAGFANIAGFVAAFWLHGLLAIFGISVLLMQSAELFFWVKMAGAAYLCWIGIRALIAAWRGQPSIRVQPARRRRTLLWASAEGFLTNALNPKVSMFYLAAFPQFMPLGESAVTVGLSLVGIHVLINTIWFSAMVLLLDRLKSAAQSQAMRRWINGATGLVFIGFGAKLATLRATG